MSDPMKFLEELVNFDSSQLTAHRRCLCGKMLQTLEHSARWFSGVVNYTEVLCAGCRKDYADKARIVCVGCKTLQGFMDPQRAATGFVFKAKRHYHIAKCPKCDPSSSATPVMEHDAFCRDQKIVTRSNLDLLQEIEQNSLRAKRESDRLRAEINSPHA